MKKSIIACLMVVAALVSGCSASIVSVQRPSAELTSKGFGGDKKAGLVILRKDEWTNNPVYKVLDRDKSEMRSVFEYGLAGLVAIDIQSPADAGLVSGEAELMAYLPVIASDASTTVPISSTAVREFLSKHQLDCLVLVNMGMVYNEKISVNIGKTAEFASRMASAAVSGVSTVGSGGGFTSSSGHGEHRVIMLYTCGEDIPLYVGGSQGTHKTFTATQVASTTVSDFKLALVGKKPEAK